MKAGFVEKLIGRLGKIDASEVQNYSAELKAITGGEGFYTIEFSHYDIVPQGIAAPVIAAARAHQTKEAE